MMQYFNDSGSSSGVCHGVLKQCTNRGAGVFIYVLYVHSLMFDQM